MTKSRYDSMGVGSNRCTKLVRFLQANFVLHKAIPIYLLAVTFKAIYIKKEQLSGSGESEMVKMRYRYLVLSTVQRHQRQRGPELSWLTVQDQLCPIQCQGGYGTKSEITESKSLNDMPARNGKYSDPKRHNLKS